MQKPLNKLLIFSFFGLLFFSCSYKSQTKNLDSWLGDYNYAENPIKANANYYMVMDWTLSINERKKTYQGILEINGQQTLIKLLIDIAGDKNTIAIIHNSIIKGSDENLKKGDTLFVLSRKSNQLYTKWLELEPRLLENSPKECSCFKKI